MQPWPTSPAGSRAPTPPKCWPSSSRTPTPGPGPVTTAASWPSASEGDPRLLWQGEATDGTFSADGRMVYVNGGADGRELMHVDLTDLVHPQVRTLLQLPAGTGPLAIAPGGRHLAGATSHRSWTGAGSPPPTTAVVVDLAATPPPHPGRAWSLWPLHHRPVERPGPDRVHSQLERPAGPTLRRHPQRRRFLARLGSLPRRRGRRPPRRPGRAQGRHRPRRHRPGVPVGRPRERGPRRHRRLPRRGPYRRKRRIPHHDKRRAARTEAPTRGAPSTTTTLPAPGDPPPTTVPTVAADPAPGDDVVALPENGGGGGTGGRPILAGGAGAALLAAGAAGLIRRRRIPKLPQL